MPARSTYLIRQRAVRYEATYLQEEALGEMTHLLHEAFKETASTGTDELTSPGDTSAARGLTRDRTRVTTTTAAVAPARL